ncbi:MAG TPA: hypothetical protein VMX17_16405, partial [Candidatus Glassbacteria bacterium]|nr:hypothetical protein [Candidatus Glassbacteria bacterium]
MQKLEKRHDNTPTDAPQIRSNCNSVIKHDCMVGQVLQNPKTFITDSEENQRQHTDGLNAIVYVLNKN